MRKKFDMKIYGVIPFRQSNKGLIHYHRLKRKIREQQQDELFKLEYQEEVIDGLFSRIDPFDVESCQDNLNKQIINIIKNL